MKNPENLKAQGNTMKPFEVINVDTVEVFCDGGGILLGHPRVYLHIDAKTGMIECPYCSCMFVLKDKRQAIRIKYCHFCCVYWLPIVKDQENYLPIAC